MAHARTHDWSDGDPELRESIRVLQRYRTTRMILAIAGLVAAFGAAALYALLSYSGR
jgi:hypothetical protein